MPREMQDHVDESEKSNLPTEFIHKVSTPLANFLRIETASGALLLVAACSAFIIANSGWSEAFLTFWKTYIGFHFGSFDFSRSIHHWINDGLMTLFFFVIALELKRALILGEMRNWKMAALPLAGAFGGILFPAMSYLILVRHSSEVHGWGTVVATDTAFALACLALFGSRIPHGLRLFLLSLAIFDDIGAILVVALGYGEALNFVALGLAVVILTLITGMARIGMRSVAIYTLLGGVVWLCFDVSGIHPTIAGVALGLMTPTRGWVSDIRLRAIFSKVLAYPAGEHWSGNKSDRSDLRQAMRAAKEVLSPVERIEMALHPWVGFVVMPLFAFANAGVVISMKDFSHPVALAVAVSLFCGKPIGVFLVSWISVRLRIATLFPGLTWSLLAAGAILTGIGFTMSLFIAELAFAPLVLTSAKLGVFIASLLSGLFGIIALSWVIFRKQK